MSHLYNLNIIHNPEFLTARTSKVDFSNQRHIVLGYTDNVEQLNNIIKLYQTNFPKAKISTCSSIESELMKNFC